MCGRFVSTSPPDELAQYFGAVAAEGVGLEANHNVAPSNRVYVVYDDGDVRHLDAFRWGLVPFWAKDLSAGNKMINARVETVRTKNAFRAAFARRRCIIPADGFYEWTKVPGHRRKQPWFIHRPDGEPFAFAGLWERWRPQNAAGNRDAAGSHDVVHTCTIITGPANDAMAPLHDRMPVILPPSAWGPWLDPAGDDLDTLGQLLVPAPPQLIAFHPVGVEVGDVRNRGPHLIEPVEVVDPDGKLAAADDTVGDAGTSR